MRKRLDPAATLVVIAWIAAFAMLLSLPAGAAGRQESSRYPAIGSGHYVASVRENGRFVILEDRSQWEIDEADRHLTAAWVAMEGISIRYAGGSGAFQDQVDNIDRDEGATARWLKP